MDSRPLPGYRRAIAVIDLGFGDAGKGLLTDYLVRRYNAHSVVRFGGGAQAGHNVVTPDGRHHTFSQFGSGTFVSCVRTYLSEKVVVHPLAILREAEHLAQLGVSSPLDQLFLCRSALVVTPFHQAAARLRELARGTARHGSCGVGVGETVADDRQAHESVLAGDLLQPHALGQKLARIQERKRAELADIADSLARVPAAAPEIQALEDTSLIQRWLTMGTPLARCIVDDASLKDALGAPGTVVLEGAHGVLLDEWRGFHPYTTYTTCTARPARELLGQHGYAGELRVLGVLRAYATRHGPGPFPTEDGELAHTLVERHNASGPWQGPMRVGWPDWVLLRYALEVAGGVDALALTHMDALPRVPAWRVAEHYDGAPFLRPSNGPNLEHQANLALRLAKAVPIYTDLGTARELPEKLERATGREVCLASYGPTANDVRTPPRRRVWAR